jgi:hypothetical protein
MKRRNSLFHYFAAFVCILSFSAQITNSFTFPNNAALILPSKASLKSYPFIYSSSVASAKYLPRLHCQSKTRLCLEKKEKSSSSDKISDNSLKSIENPLLSPSSSISCCVSSPSSSATSAALSSSSSSSIALFNPTSAHLKKTNPVKSFLSSQAPLLSYLWPKDDPSLRYYLFVSFIFLYIGNYCSLKVPFILQEAIDSLTNLHYATSTAAGSASSPSLASISSFLLSSEAMKHIQKAFVWYGIMRVIGVAFTELKTCYFSHVTQSILRKFAYQTFVHLHSLDSTFHLTTPSGVISVAYVRAVRGFQCLLLEIVFSIAPIIMDLSMVSMILYRKFGGLFSFITLVTFLFYLLFTVYMTSFRVKLRQSLVDTDNARNGFFIDSILNHEVVKLFTNEKHEITKFDNYLEKIQHLSIDCTSLIAKLNVGQSFLFSTGLSLSMLLALRQVMNVKMTVGDLIAVNGMLLQLAIPFNNLGYTCKNIEFTFNFVCFTGFFLTLLLLLACFPFLFVFSCCFRS